MPAVKHTLALVFLLFPLSLFNTWMTDVLTHIINCVLPRVPVDVVYTWVNGTDPEWSIEKRYWEEQEQLFYDRSEEQARFIQHDELRYSFRSISRNIPWIHTIYLVTNGQIPYWLNTSHPQIQIITHENIMPKASLPTFNSDAIEANLASIPGLKEHFLFANDDTFVRRPTTPLFFFSVFGNPRFHVGIDDITKRPCDTLYCNTILFASRLFESHYGIRYTFEPSHNIIPYRRSDYQRCVNVFHRAFRNNTFSKFRSDRCLHRTIVAYFSVTKKRASIIWNSRRGRATDTLYLPLTSEKIIHRKLRKNNPTLVCINDEPNSNDRDRMHFPSVLQRLFPKESPWELR